MIESEKDVTEDDGASATAESEFPAYLAGVLNRYPELEDELDLKQAEEYINVNNLSAIDARTLATFLQDELDVTSAELVRIEAADMLDDRTKTLQRIYIGRQVWLGAMTAKLYEFLTGEAV